MKKNVILEFNLQNIIKIRIEQHYHNFIIFYSGFEIILGSLIVDLNKTNCESFNDLSLALKKYKEIINRILDNWVYVY